MDRQWHHDGHVTRSLRNLLMTPSPVIFLESLICSFTRTTRTTGCCRSLVLARAASASLCTSAWFPFPQQNAAAWNHRPAERTAWWEKWELSAGPACEMPPEKNRAARVRASSPPRENIAEGHRPDARRSLVNKQSGARQTAASPSSSNNNGSVATAKSSRPISSRPISLVKLRGLKNHRIGTRRGWREGILC